MSISVSKTRLKGTVKISGAKNSALRLLAASILTPEAVKITNFPSELLDIQVHIGMLELLGKRINLADEEIEIDEIGNLPCTELLWEDRSIRNTLLILGALLTRFGKGKVPIPGGCNLGERKYDLHMMAMKAFGASVREEDGYLLAVSKNDRLIGTEILLPLRSTGATENSIIMATLAKGKTRILNPHIRPEIMDLISFLNKMGAEIRVFGQYAIEVEGVEYLKGVEHRVIPDNMEALTWCIASVVTSGDIEIHDFPFSHLEVPLVFLKESGMKSYRGENSLLVRGGNPFPVEISTGPYPGINSDMQPLFAVYGAVATGRSKIIDLRFPGRYGYAEELRKMGVEIYQKDGFLVINGGKELKGAKVKALDLRAGVALLLLGLTIDDETIIEDDWQISRGYNFFQQKLNNLMNT
jgi:UDP-N-acetylglucosamine 1-carboxyvinyltransferase